MRAWNSCVRASRSWGSLVGLHEALQHSLDLVGGNPQRGPADTDRPDLTTLDLVVDRALVQAEVLSEVFDLPVLLVEIGHRAPPATWLTN